MFWKKKVFIDQFRGIINILLVCITNHKNKQVQLGWKLWRQSSYGSEDGGNLEWNLMAKFRLDLFHGEPAVTSAASTAQGTANSFQLRPFSSSPNHVVVCRWTFPLWQGCCRAITRSAYFEAWPIVPATQFLNISFSFKIFSKGCILRGAYPTCSRGCRGHPCSSRETSPASCGRCTHAP